MAPNSRTLFDPTRDTAAMLRRMGVLVLMVALPLSAPVFRIGPVVAYAVGCVLLIAAGTLDGSPRVLRDNLRRILASLTFLAAFVTAVWAAVSLLWTPAVAWRPTFGLGVVLALGFAALLALPERMRSSNLYPIPIGAGALALVAIALGAGFWGDGDEERLRLFERTLAILVLLAWPGIAWLRSRGRDFEALALAIAVALAAAIGGGIAPITAFALGALAYLVSQVFTRGATTIGALLAAILVLAPVIFALIPESIRNAPDWATTVGLWRAALLDDPARLLTGHGFGSLASRPDLPEVGGHPMVALAGLWYEFGIVGMGAMAVAVAAVLAAASRHFGPLVPAVAAAVTTAFVLGLARIGGGALWWPVALVTVALLFVAAQRGQFRTRRPRALADFMVRSGAR